MNKNDVEFCLSYLDYSQNDHFKIMEKKTAKYTQIANKGFLSGQYDL